MLLFDKHIPKILVLKQYVLCTTHSVHKRPKSVISKSFQKLLESFLVCGYNEDTRWFTKRLFFKKFLFQKEPSQGGIFSCSNIKSLAKIWSKMMVIFYFKLFFLSTGCSIIRSTLLPSSIPAQTPANKPIHQPNHPPIHHSTHKLCCT